MPRSLIPSSSTTAISAGASKLRRCIVEKNVRIPEDTTIGYDLAEDKKRYIVSDSGIVVVEGSRTPVELTKIVL